MLKGKYYVHACDELRALSRRCREFMYEFNFSGWDESDYRNKLIKDIFGSVGRKYSILQTFKCCYGCNIRIGENFFANYDCAFLDVAEIDIGDNVFIGPRTMLLTAGHPLDKDIRNEHLEYGLSITVGNDVWLGGGVIVNPGKRIGENTVIGSGSVVTHDIPSGVVAAGNPCRVIRAISDEDIEKCRRLRAEYYADKNS